MFRVILTAIFMLSGMVSGMTNAIAGDSHIVADPTAPRPNQPQVIGTGNGLPQVNISTPNGNGLSYNRYQQFDVGRQGAILNNSTKDVQTQLGGWIERNPNLAKGSASLIVNEVNSSRPSHLGGFIEIAGQRADVVIANPSGISVDGSGFINANRATLTTGVPRIENGSLAGFDVTGGRIDIQGQGLNAKGSNYTDIIAESAVINAGIWANQLNVVTGRNFVSGDSSSVTNIDPDAETGISLDVKAVGGMYANQIRLVGTGRGVGVNSGMNNEGNIFAQVGEVHISEDGMLSNSGVISGQSGMNVAVGDEIVNTGSMQSGGELVMTGDKSIDNQGDILSAGSASFAAKENFQNSGTVSATGDLSVTTGGDINNENSITSGGVASFDAGKGISNTAEIQADGGLSLTTRGGDLKNTKNILTNGDLSLSITGNLINSGELGVGEKISGTITGNLNNTGQILAGSSDFTTRAAFINTGLIDGGSLIIRAGSIDNINTGTILGDHLSLMADTYILNGLPLGKAGTGTSGLIGARDRLDLAARDITNREDGLLYSAGDIYIGGTLDVAGIASGRAGTLLNASALIDAGGGVFAAVDQFTNRNDHYKTELRVIRDESFQAVSLDARTYYKRGELGSYWDDGDYANIGGNTKEDYYIHDVRIIEKDTFVIESRPGTLYTGGDFSVDGSLTNDHSRIVSGGTIQVAPSDKLTVTGSFTNIAAMEPYYYDESHWIHYTTVEADGWFGGHKREHHGGYSYAPPTVVKYNEKNVVLAPYASASVAEQSMNSAAPSAGSLSLNLNANMYTMNPSPTSEYLVETNPRLTDYRSWLSSDFMLERVAADPGTILKRLGDGFYEQRLVRDQIVNKTGLRYLEGYSSDEEQYLALMTSGVEFAEEFDLTLGVSLSPEQMAQLTSDIVWLEYVTVDTPEGPQQVLTPVVYLAPGRETVINPAGTLASGKNVILDLNGDFANTGNVFGSEVVSVDADRITNGGTIAGGLVNLAAIRDIDNSGGRISGVDGVDLQAGNDIIIASTTQTASRSGGGYSGTATTIDRVGSVEVTGENGSLSMDAGRDININAGIVSSAGDASLTAGRDVNIGVVEEALDYTTRADDKNGFDLHKSMDRGSVIMADKGLTIQAGNDVAIKGSAVASADDLNIQAGNDVTITEGRQMDDFNSLLHTEDENFWRTKTETRNNHTVTDTGSASSLSGGGTVNIASGNDFTLQGSGVMGGEGVSVNAGGDISVKAADTSTYNYSYSESERSGFQASLTKGKLNVAYGETSKSSEGESHRTGVQGSSITSVNGPVDLYAGKDVTISASGVTSGGDLAISGENVSIEDVAATTDSWSKTVDESSLIGLNVSLGGRIGDVIDSGYAFDTVMKDRQTAKGQGDSQIDTLYDLLAARSGINLGKSITDLGMGINNTSIINGEVTDKKVNMNGSEDLSNIFAPSNGNFGLKADIGYSYKKDTTSTESQGSISVGSTVQSEGNATIIARGENGGQAGTGDLTVIGSKIESNGKVTLDANNDISLIAGENRSSSKSETDNISGGIKVGATLGKDGWGINASGEASMTLSDSDSSSHTYNETIVNGKEGVEFSSGSDTNIKGAQIIGKGVVGTVGGDLNIESLQDVKNEEFEEETIGGSITIPIYGANKGSGKLSYGYKEGDAGLESVKEVSGIDAQEDGFQITVSGNTGLVGGHISSTADSSDNILVTGTLTTEDIKNSSSYSVSNGGISLNPSVIVEMEKTKDENGVEKDSKSPTNTAKDISLGLVPGLSQNDSGNDSSVTEAAISDGTIIITNETAQKEITGKNADETIADLQRNPEDAHGALADNPNLKMILGQQGALAQMAGKLGKAMQETVGDITNIMGKAVSNNPKEAEKWKAGGIYNTALSAAASALMVEHHNGEGIQALLSIYAAHLADGNISAFSKEMAATLGKDQSDAMKKAIENSISVSIKQGLGYGISGGSSTGANVVTPRP